MRMISRAFGITSSGGNTRFFLPCTAADNHSGVSASTVEALVRNVCVDNIPKSLETVADALTCISELIPLCASGGFKVSKFVCNDPLVLEAIPDPLRAVGVRSIDFDQVCSQKILGVGWDPISDNFMVSMHAVPGAMMYVVYCLC